MFKMSLLCSAALMVSVAVGVTASAGAQENAIPNFSFIDSGWLLQGGINFRPIPGKVPPIATTISATSETVSQTATVTVAGTITEIVEKYLPPGETRVNQTAGVSLALSDYMGANLSQTNFAQVLFSWLFS